MLKLIHNCQISQEGKFLSGEKLKLVLCMYTSLLETCKQLDSAAQDG